ncbi:MAG: PKD domain-containing protein [Steroidobacter sp.]
MSAFLKDWRTACFTLLGLAASVTGTSALADALADFNGTTLHCASCHGAPGTGVLTVAQLNTDYPTNGKTNDPAKAGKNGGKGLANYINTAMPKDAVGNCNSACGSEMAHLLRPLPPVADTGMPANQTGAAPLNVSFDASASTNLTYCDNGCTSYVWNFDDGTASGSGPTLSHTFTKLGTHNVTLTVTDAQGLTTTSSPLAITVSSLPPPPVANAHNTSNLNGAAPLAVQFDGSLSTCGSVCTYAWNFGDGATGLTGATDKFFHNYTVAGTYTITLTVTDVNTGQQSVDTLHAYVVTGESLQTYVQNCENELHFNAGDVPAMSCNDGVRFSGTDTPFSTLINDFLIYKRINDTVDLAVACRWGDAHLAPLTKAASIEMIIHNRQNGSTCFFAAKDTNPDVTLLQRVSTNIVSPTNFSNVHPNANDFWLQPAGVDSRQLPNDHNVFVNRPETFPSDSDNDSVRCVGCHVEGPYVASADIAPFLAQYGLLNNGHDTIANMNAANHYHAVSSSDSGHPTNGTSAFRAWDSFIYNNMIEDATGKPVTDCSGACHSIGRNSTTGDVFTIPGGVTRLLPSLIFDINFFESQGIGMPPFDSLSDYQWTNLDTPFNSTPATGVESESFADAMNHTANSIVPVLFTGQDSTGQVYNPNCPQPGPNNVPGALEAHVVGIPGDYAFTTDTMSLIPDRLRTFNLKEGLVCVNSDQEPGHSCHEYSIRYLCSVSNVDHTAATWSGWYNMDSVGNDGDYENRWKDQNICGGATPIGIQARVLAGGSALDIMGPNDRLARFSPYGLTCNAADQVDGQCSNYVVRYDYCSKPPQQYPGHLTNAWSNMQLTATGNSNNASTRGQPYTPSWNTQQWMIEPVPNTEYVRLRNTGTSTYLNVTTQSDGATVVTYALNNDWDSEKWIVEHVSGSNTVRLKNLWSGKYLTLGDSSNYSPVYSQGLNTGWASQRWLIQ